MYSDKDIEYINQLRIDLANSEAYALGRRMTIFKKMIRRGKIISLIKIVTRHRKVNKLKKPLGKYSEPDKNSISPERKKIVIFSCITGGYDCPLEPIFSADNIDYVLFCDNRDKPKDATKWQIRKISDLNLVGYSNDEKNRYIKFHSNELFAKEYDYAIYIDGNIQVVSDIRKMIEYVSDKTGIAMHRHRERKDVFDEYEVCKAIKKGDLQKMKVQIERYREEGFPDNYGMAEANVIAIDLKSPISNKIMSDWWDEYESSGSRRDQIALPYVLWKNNISVSDVTTLGSNVYANNMLMIKQHVVGEGIE